MSIPRALWRPEFSNPLLTKLAVLVVGSIFTCTPGGKPPSGVLKNRFTSDWARGTVTTPVRSTSQKSTDMVKVAFGCQFLIHLGVYTNPALKFRESSGCKFL